MGYHGDVHLDDSHGPISGDLLDKNLMPIILKKMYDVYRYPCYDALVSVLCYVVSSVPFGLGGIDIC